MEGLSAFYSHFDWQTAKNQTFKNSKCAYWSETSRTRDRNLELLGPFSKCPHQHGWPKPTLRFCNSVWVSLLGVGDSVSGVPSCSLPGIYQQEAGAGSTAGLGSMHPWTRLHCLPRSVLSGRACACVCVCTKSCIILWLAFWGTARLLPTGSGLLYIFTQLSL